MKLTTLQVFAFACLGVFFASSAEAGVAIALVSAKHTHPGDTLTFVVTTDGADKNKRLHIILDTEARICADDLEFILQGDTKISCQIPLDQKPGKFDVSVAGGIPGNPDSLVISNEVRFIVDPSSIIQGVIVWPAQLRMIVGQRKQLEIDADVDANERKADYFSLKGMVTLRSGDPKIATGDEDGVVVAVSPGQTTMEIAYTNEGRGSEVVKTIPISVVAPKPAQH